MNRQQVLDLYFQDARFQLVELAAFLDRGDRAQGQPDFRWEAFLKAAQILTTPNAKANRAEQVLLALSDPTLEPILAATTKAACGAFPPST